MGLPTRILLAAVAVALTAWLLWLGVSTHMHRACVLMDTPYLPICPGPPPQGGEQHKDELRARLRVNPGDSEAWVALARVETGAAQQALLPILASLAPNDPTSLWLRARDALARDQMPVAVALLVQMTDYSNGGPEPAQVLGRLIASGKGVPLLRPHLVAGSRWLPPVIVSMKELKLPIETAFPLLAEAAAKRVVPQESVQSFIRSLKAEGKWADAYGLWVMQQRQPVPLLFNGGFEQSFQTDGFDWEVTPAPPSRAGARVARRNLAGHGQVLEVDYTGRAVATPVIRQYLFVAPGRYELGGQFMTSKLRIEQGLAWAVRCTNAPQALAGRSAPLRDTASVWQSFRLDIDVSPACGMAVSLQLETFAPYEAAVGFTGKAFFDGLELRRANQNLTN